MHPGLLLAGETLAALEGHHQRADHQTSTWIMFAGSEASPDGKKSHGILARLTLERLSKDGRGLLVPDPFASGYLQMERSFSTGLQHAWLAACMADKQARNYDWRWRIEIEEATRETPFASLVSPCITGPSAEGALTCGMLAVGNGDELDRNTCMSATLALPLQSTLKLDIVDGLDVKTLSDRLKVKKIRDIVVCEHQKDIDLDTGSQHHFEKTANIADAMDHFCIWPRITRTVRQKIREEATAERRWLCGPLIPADRQAAEGTDYVQSPIGIRLPEREWVANGDLRKEPKPLTDVEIRQFVSCQWHPPQADESAPIRLQLFADSGMGKTMQLLICEQTIARDNTQRIPIRLGKRASLNRLTQAGKVPDIPERPLDLIEWRGPLNENLVQLAEILVRHFPPEHQHRATAWVERMAELGQFVFLLDALDQHRSMLTHLATFLTKQEICQCPVLVAGRPESLTTRGEVFTKQRWHRLELLKLQDRQQRLFLGATRSAELIPSEEELHSWHSADEHRRHQWKDLLGIPLLISLMKQLATPDKVGLRRLDGIQNRFTLNQQASRHLFRKGKKSLEIDEQDAAAKMTETLLKDIAGHMAEQHNFNVLEGDEFDTWMSQSKLEPEQLRQLVQIDMVKEYAFLDRIELEDLADQDNPIRRGIEWRHRSFLEYYAALSLADQWEANPHTVRTILRDVHECLDEHGHYRTWLTWDANSGSWTTTFRNLPGDWQWTLRFLLACSTEPARSQIALGLMSMGNPWVVVLAMQQDHVELYDQNVATACRWLVHLNQTADVDYTNAVSLNGIQGVPAEPETSMKSISVDDARVAYRELARVNPSLTESLLNPTTRDAGIFASLRLLNPTTRDAGIFASLRSLRPAMSQRHGNLWQQRTTERQEPLKRFLDKSRWVSVPGFPGTALSDFPVTNAVFESFCASHRRWRSPYSLTDDQPVLYVSWHMVMEFCAWLTAICPDNRRYSLPHEDLWYAACQWDRPCQWKYWWAGEMDDSLCWYGASSNGPAKAEPRTRSRKEAITAFDGPGQKHPSWKSPQQPGLLDMLGNVWEWCLNPYSAKADPNDPGSSRVCRGGSWRYDAVDCESGRRYSFTPDDRISVIGFRLCVE